jgi:NTE family protein
MSARTICLALQGGGSHGAYTSGVLERLLDEKQLGIEAISGASAGAVNAAVLAYGYMNGGRAGASTALQQFWQSVASANVATFPVSQSMLDPAMTAYVSLSRHLSPTQLNPLNINPLRQMLARHIDFEALHAASPMRLFISATRVHDGALRIFTERDLTLDALLASACIPSLHHAVEIDGASYWDGALTANPPLSVLAYDCAAPDIVLVSLTPHAAAASPPATADAIVDHVVKIAFSASLSTEFHSIALAKARADSSPFAFGVLDRRLRRLQLHTIEAAAQIGELAIETRFKTDAAFIRTLRRLGHDEADAWLRTHWNARRRPRTLSMREALNRCSVSPQCSP